MISEGLIRKIYDAAFIQRWNDHARPIELIELDKQAHKTVIAYILAKFEESERKTKINWKDIIEGVIFEFFQRVVLTDIKPTVYHRMMEKKGQELNKWVLKKLEKPLQGLNENFKERLSKYLFDTNSNNIERKIIKAAHYLATNWEFKIIYNINSHIYGIEKTKEEIENQIEDHYDLAGVQRMLLGKKTFGFIDLCGQLRFQQRWPQSPRIPKTSVLGHMLIVAILTYFCSEDIGACEKRLYNNFFGGLFHDLPEVLTRDIITPVKRSIKGLEEIIQEYEKISMEEKLLPLLPASWREEMNYLTREEFKNKINLNGEIIKNKTIEEINRSYNEDIYSPIDGEIIKACDDLAAFVEASISIESGIKSHHLKNGIDELYSKYKNKKIFNIDFDEIFRYFIKT